MKFSAIAILALTTGAFALPGGKGPDPRPKDPKPPKPEKPTNKNNNNNSQNMQCGNGQSLYCCYNEDGNKNDVTCASFSNGGLGGICNGIQVCCQNNVSNHQSQDPICTSLTGNYRTESRAATLATVVARSPSRTSPTTGVSPKWLDQSTSRDFSEGLEQHFIGSYKPLTLLTIFHDHFTTNAFTRDEIGTGFGRRFTSDGF